MAAALTAVAPPAQAARAAHSAGAQWGQPAGMSDPTAGPRVPADAPAAACSASAWWPPAQCPPVAAASGAGPARRPSMATTATARRSRPGPGR